MPAQRTRRRDTDDDMPTAVPYGDIEDDEDEDGEEPEVDTDLGVRHARAYARPVPARDADEDEDAGDDSQVIPDRVVPLVLPKPWQRLKLWVWLDYPEDVAQLFGPKREGESDEDTQERNMEFFRTVVVQHGGWRDREGVLPQPGKRAFWRRISTPLGNAIVQQFLAVMRRNPTQRDSRKPRPKR